MAALPSILGQNSNLNTAGFADMYEIDFPISCSFPPHMRYLSSPLSNMWANYCWFKKSN